MKVIARHEFENIIDATIQRPRRAGEVFDVDEARANLLLEHHLIEVLPQEIKGKVVGVVEDIEIVEKAEPKAEIKVKKPRKKK